MATSSSSTHDEVCALYWEALQALRDRTEQSRKKSEADELAKDLGVQLGLGQRCENVEDGKIGDAESMAPKHVLVDAKTYKALLF